MIDHNGRCMDQRTDPHAGMGLSRARYFLQRAGIALCALLVTMSVARAQAQVVTPTATQLGANEVKVSFAQLGAGSMELHGVQAIGAVNLGARMDEVIVAAKLRLRMTYSPAMIADLSHLRVTLNGQVLAALPLPKEQAGREIEREVVLDPRYFSDYNQLRFDLIGHYSLECEDPQHSSLWATISQFSELELTLRPLELRNDLALLPAPFFDRRDNRRVVLPIVLPAKPSRDIVRTAGVAASWFGMLADYRSARFPVTYAELPDRHALVFATNAAKPPQLTLGDVDKATLSIVDHPTDRLVKLLVFQGKDEAQLRQAVEGLVLGNPVLTGTSATIEAVEYARRAAYDAPRWLRTDRPVRLGELVDTPQQLQSAGISPPPIRINMRLPPDLFTWNRSGVPVDLRYRYTAPSERDNSMLSVSINEQLLRSYRLQAESEQSAGDKLLVPLLEGASAQQTDGFVIPAFQLASNNQMQFQFALEHHRKGLCTEVFSDTTRQSIDPDSTIDVSGFPHYTSMPNLALFANAGYPFTRYADLAETAIVLADTTRRETLEQLFFVLGRMSRQTGAVGVGYRLLDTEQARTAKDADLLILSTGTNRLLDEWGKELSLVLNDTGRTLNDPADAPGFDPQLLDDAREVRAPNARVSVGATGSLGAFISFESPVSGSRTVVALTGTDAAATDMLVDVLEDEGKVPLIRGDLAIVRAGNVQSYLGDDSYYVGSLPWWKWLWFHLSRHPVLLTLVTLAVATVVALWVYGWLQRRVARRLKTESG
jgi:cellulose synthase operon protein B